MDLCFIVDGLSSKRGSRCCEQRKLPKSQGTSSSNETNVCGRHGLTQLTVVSSAESGAAKACEPADKHALNGRGGITHSKFGSTEPLNCEIPISSSVSRSVCGVNNNPASFTHMQYNTAADAIHVQRTNTNSTLVFPFDEIPHDVLLPPPSAAQALFSHEGKAHLPGSGLQSSNNGPNSNSSASTVSQLTPLHPEVRLRPPTLPPPMVPPPQHGLLPPVNGPKVAANSDLLANYPAYTESQPPPTQRIVVMETKFYHKTHIDSKTKQYACRHCGRTFLRRSDFVRHFQIHVGVKPNLCSICGKAFIQRSALTVHTRVHTGEKPYTCQVCGRLFSDSSSLARHRRIHLRQQQEKQAQSQKQPSLSSAHGSDDTEGKNSGSMASCYGERTASSAIANGSRNKASRDRPQAKRRETKK